MSAVVPCPVFEQMAVTVCRPQVSGPKLRVCLTMSLRCAGPVALASLPSFLAVLLFIHCYGGVSFTPAMQLTPVLPRWLYHQTFETCLPCPAVCCAVRRRIADSAAWRTATGGSIWDHVQTLVGCPRGPLHPSWQYSSRARRTGSR